MIHHVYTTVVCDCDALSDQQPHLRWNVGPVSDQPITTGPLGARYMLQLKDTQQVRVSIQAVDRKGAPASVQSVSFTSSDTSVCAVTQTPLDPNSALVVAGLPGTCQVRVSADADLGDGVSNISSVLDVTVVGGQAVALTINAAVPEEQP